MTDTVGWYEANARTFFERSVGAPILDQQRAFADRLPRGGRVLDAGCGSGRDARQFRAWGFEVTAIEAAPALAALAREHAGVDVRVMTFDQIDWIEAFEGIWACASLLHVPRADLPATLRRLRRSLVPGGHWFMSFKHGDGERDINGRRFTDLDEAGAARLLEETGGLELLSTMVSGDVRAGREREPWLSVLCRRAG